MTTNQLHRMLLDNLNTAVLLLDADLSIDYLNPAAEVLLQASSLKLRGTIASDLFSNNDLSLQTLRDALETGHPHIRRHEYLRLPTSESSQVDYTITPVDINTSRMLLMEMQPIDRFLKINREEALLSVHHTSKSLIRGLAHEIKNPLGGIVVQHSCWGKKLPRLVWVVKRRSCARLSPPRQTVCASRRSPARPQSTAAPAANQYPRSHRTCDCAY